MAINHTRLATRIGHLLASVNEVNTYRGTTLAGRVTTVAGDYTTVNPDLISSLYDQQVAARQSFSGWVSYLKSLLSDLIVDEVTNDVPLANASLSSCLAEWRRQMLRDSESLNHSLVTLGSVTAVGSPTSNTQFITTDKDGTAVSQDLIVPDSYLIRVAADDQRGASTYAETLSIVGKKADTDPTDETYPTGAGINTTKSIIDPALARGLVTDPGFDAWTVSNTPDDWTIVAPAVAGTNVFKASDDPRDSSGTSLRILSTASGTVKLRQAVTLTPNTVYAVHFKYKPVANGSATPSAVIAKVRLVDGSGTVIQDDAANDLSLSGSTHAVVTVGSGWNNGYQAYFITPTTLPDTVYLEITQDSDAAGADGYYDHVNLVAVTPLYTGGPYLDAFSGKTRAVENDTWTWAITLTTGTVSQYIIRGLDRTLGLKSLGIRLPTSGTPTQSDSLIV